MNNEAKKNEYLEKYSDSKDSIDESEREALRIPVDKIINSETKKERKEKARSYIIIGVILFLSVIVLMILTRRYVKKQKKPKKSSSKP
ncbi:hypothetical protein [Chryseobacterium wanjuense]